MLLSSGVVLADRYEIGSRLGAGAQAVTYGALDRQTGQPVVVKELALSRLEEWKPLDLFEREARILAHLQHPRIPRLIEFFHREEDEDLLLYLVTSRVPGRPLSARLEEGWLPQEIEVRRIAHDVLFILEYLQGLNPLVVHRDIKPSNLVQDDAREIYLVDFGSVRDAVRPLGGSTVVGTFGYMAPELFTGQAGPASDLYGLGATLVHLLSGVPPDQIPQREMRLRFRPLVSCSGAFAAWIERLLEPVAERRFTDAAEARQALAALVAGKLTAADLAQGYAAPRPPGADEEDETSDAYRLIIGSTMVGGLVGLGFANALVDMPWGALGSIPGALLGGMAAAAGMQDPGTKPKTVTWKGRLFWTLAGGLAGAYCAAALLIFFRLLTDVTKAPVPWAEAPIVSMLFISAGALVGAVCGALGTASAALLDRLAGMLFGTLSGTLFGAVIGALLGMPFFLIGSFFGTIFGMLLGAPAGLIIGAVGGVGMVRRLVNWRL